MSEEWRAVPGFEGAYEVSDQGRVRSLARRVRAVYRGSESTRSVPPCVLRPGRMPFGHQSVMLGKAAGSHCVHALVMLAFVGPPPTGHEVRHLNGDPADNRLENLCYGTRGENTRDKKWHAGTRATKLWPEDVVRLKQSLRDGGESMQKIANRHGVSRSLVHAIAHGKVHADV